MRAERRKRRWPVRNSVERAGGILQRAVIQLPTVCNGQPGARHRRIPGSHPICGRCSPGGCSFCARCGRRIRRMSVLRRGPSPLPEPGAGRPVLVVGGAGSASWRPGTIRRELAGPISITFQIVVRSFSEGRKTHRESSRCVGKDLVRWSSASKPRAADEEIGTVRSSHKGPRLPFACGHRQLWTGGLGWHQMGSRVGIARTRARPHALPAIGFPGRDHQPGHMAYFSAPRGLRMVRSCSRPRIHPQPQKTVAAVGGQIRPAIRQSDQFVAFAAGESGSG